MKYKISDNTDNLYALVEKDEDNKIDHSSWRHDQHGPKSQQKFFVRSAWKWKAYGRMVKTWRMK